MSNDEGPPATPAALRFMRAFAATFRLLHRRGHSQGVVLTPEGRALLLHLAWTGPLTIGELALHVERAQSVVSESVAALESRGLLDRVRDPRDRRRTLVWLTQRAREWLAEEQEPLDRERTSAALEALSPAERDQLIERFEQFIEVAERTRQGKNATSPSAAKRHPDRTVSRQGRGKTP